MIYQEYTDTTISMNVLYKAIASGASFILPFPLGNASAILERILLSAPAPKAIE